MEIRLLDLGGNAKVAARDMRMSMYTVLISGHMSNVGSFEFVSRLDSCFKIGDDVFILYLIFSNHLIDDEF